MQPVPRSRPCSSAWKRPNTAATRKMPPWSNWRTACVSSRKPCRTPVKRWMRKRPAWRKNTRCCRMWAMQNPLNAPYAVVSDRKVQCDDVRVFFLAAPPRIWFIEKGAWRSEGENCFYLTPWHKSTKFIQSAQTKKVVSFLTGQAGLNWKQALWCQWSNMWTEKVVRFR